MDLMDCAIDVGEFIPGLNTLHITNYNSEYDCIFYKITNKYDNSSINRIYPIAWQSTRRFSFEYPNTIIERCIYAHGLKPDGWYGEDYDK